MERKKNIYSVLVARQDMYLILIRKCSKGAFILVDNL